MAQATVRNATVMSTFFDGKAARVAEEYTHRGEVRKNYTVLWFKDPHGLDKGDIITVTGLASVKMGKDYVTADGEKREGKPELHINVTESPKTVSEPSFDQDVPF